MDGEAIAISLLDIQYILNQSKRVYIYILYIA